MPVTPPTPTPEQLGDSLQGHQRYQAAIAVYAKDPHPSAALWNKMGIAHQMMFNLKDAARCYKESLKLDPRNAQVLNNLATVYDSSKDLSGAEKMYRKALKLDPKSAVILKNLGTNLLAQRKYTRGWQAYQEALAIDPNIFQDSSSPKIQNPSSVAERGAMNYYMARGCARTGQPDCAIEYLRMALNEGFTNAKKLAADEDFTSLRSNPAFKQLLADQQQQRNQ
jgi:Tfp pilus assembly protein PilF